MMHLPLPESDKDYLRSFRGIFANPAERRRMLGDGNFHGVYQRTDSDMQALWDVAVAETRAVIEGDWRAGQAA